MRLQIAAAVAFAAACSASAFTYLDSRATAATPLAGPPKLLGMSVGVASFADVTAATHRANLTCEAASAMPSDQVRYACDGVPASLLGGASNVIGRLLFVHENANKPVQLIAYERHHTDPAAATADLTATLHTLETRYGKPAVSHGGDELVTLEPIVREWRVAGTTVRFRALAYGARGTSISEEITLPVERG